MSKCLWNHICVYERSDVSAMKNKSFLQPIISYFVRRIFFGAISFWFFFCSSLFWWTNALECKFQFFFLLSLSFEWMQTNKTKLHINYTKLFLSVVYRNLHFIPFQFQISAHRPRCIFSLNETLCFIGRIIFKNKKKKLTKKSKRKTINKKKKQEK